LAQQVAGIFDNVILRRGHIIGDIVSTRGALKGGHDRRDDVVDMHTAENLIGHVDAVRLAFCHPLQCRSAGSVNAGQAEDMDILVQALPRKVGFGSRGAASRTHRGAFVDPCAAGIAINARGG